MPKGSRRVAGKGSLYGKGRKSRKKRQTVRHAAPPTSKRIIGQGSAFSTRPTSNAQQIAPLQPHVLSDLKRIGIIAVAMIVILVILYIVL